jgi:hypothetical protein
MLKKDPFFGLKVMFLTPKWAVKEKAYHRIDSTWKRATAAGVLGSMIGGAAAVLCLQLTGYEPLGMWPGVWGFAEEFIGYINQNLSKYKFI